MAQPKRLMVRVEEITFEDCETAAKDCGRYDTEEEIETYAHELEAKSGDYGIDDYIKDCGWDEMGGDPCWGVIPVSVWLAWLDEAC